MTVLREFKITIDADAPALDKIKQVDQALDKIKKDGQKGLFDRFNDNVAKPLQQMRGRLLAVAGAVGFLGKKFVAEAENIGATAEEFNISTDGLQALWFAAQQADVPVEGLEQSMRVLSRRAHDAASGSKEAIKAFADIGVKATKADGSMKDLGELLPEVFDGLANNADGAERMALAQEIMGRSGSRLIPLINKQSTGLAALFQQFKAQGGGISPEAIESARKLGDELDKVRTAILNLAGKIFEQLGPSLIDAVQKFQGVIEKARIWLSSTGNMEQAMIGLKAAVIAFGAALAISFLPLTTAIAIAGSAFVIFSNLKDLIQALKLVFMDFFDVVEKGFKKVFSPIQALMDFGGNLGAGFAGALQGEIASNTNRQGLPGANAGSTANVKGGDVNVVINGNADSKTMQRAAENIKRQNEKQFLDWASALPALGPYR